MIKINLQFFGEKVYVDATDKNGKKVEGAYAIDGKTYKADGTRIDAGTSVVTAGGTFTYNGDGTSSKTSNKTSSSGSSGGAFVGGGSTPTQTTTVQRDIGTELQNAYNAGNWAKVLELDAERKGKIANAGGALDQYANQYDNLVKDAQRNNAILQEQQQQQALAQDLATALKEQQVNKLNQSYQNVLNQIASGERDTINNARNSSNRASVQNQLQTARLNRQFANAGLTNSGTGAQMNINQAGALQNALSGIEAQKNEQLDNYITQRTNAYNNLVGDINATEAGIDATMLQNQLNNLSTLQNMYLQRQWQLEDEDRNLVNWVDPYTGQTYRIPATSASSLGASLYGNTLKGSSGGSYSSGNGGTSIDEKTLSSLQKEWMGDEVNYGMDFVEWVKKYRPQYYNAVINSGYYDIISNNNDEITPSNNENNNKSAFEEFLKWYGDNALSNKILFGDKKKEDNTKLTKDEQILKAFGF